jgi:glycerophosphoryl diester phosphodiesterase
VSPDWLRIAHRGASGSAPEHTPAAFERALEIGVDMIELDVQLSRDARLVVIHDAELGRTTSGSGAVRESDWASLQRLDAGAWFDPGFAGQRVLCLEEVIDLVDGQARLNVEIKSAAADWPAVAERLVDLLHARGLVDSTVVSSFAAGALASVRELSDAVRLGVLWHDPDCAPAWTVASQLGAHSFHPHWAIVGAELLAEARRRKLQVLTWTVNEPELMARLIELGVDGIISDHPELFADVQERDRGGRVLTPGAETLR